jgi:hypothetical protein
MWQYDHGIPTMVARFPHLRVLALGRLNADMVDSDAMLSMLSDLQQLRHLTIDHWEGLTPAGIKVGPRCCCCCRRCR